MFCAAHFSTCGHVSCNHYMYMSDSTCWCATWTAVSSEQVTDLIFQSNCLTCPLSHLVFPQSKDFLITQSKHGRDEEKNKRKKEKKELQWPTHWTHWSAQVWSRVPRGICCFCSWPRPRERRIPAVVLKSFESSGSRREISSSPGVFLAFSYRLVRGFLSRVFSGFSLFRCRRDAGKGRRAGCRCAPPAPGFWGV